MIPSGEPGQPAALGDGSAVDLSVWTLLQRVGSYIRHQPRSVIPFVVAGVVVAITDWIRTTDPLPMLVPDSFSETVSVQYRIVPMGTQRTARAVDALVNLRTPYLLGAVALELLVLASVAGAGYLTLRWVLGTNGNRRVAVRYGLLVTAVGFVPQWLGMAQFTFTNLVVGIVAIVLFSVVAVRLFLFPGFVVAGESARTALRQSRHRSRGIGWTLFGLVVVFGVTSWGLAQIPVAGGFLSTAVVGSVHATALGVLVRDIGRSNSR